MVPDLESNLEDLAKVYNSLSSYNRVYTFCELHHGTEAKHIAQDLDLTRTALQPYITDWKELGLIYTEDNDYQFTEQGEAVRSHIDDILEMLNDGEIGDDHYEHWFSED